MNNGPSMLHVLQSYINATTARQAHVVDNVANIDTPGYHTQDIDFRKAFADALNSADPVQPVASHPVEGLLERPDGNNVSLDRESLALSETQLQFRMGVQLIRTEFHRLSTAINEGKQ